MGGTSALAAMLPDVSRETVERLQTHLALLRQWNPRINLVSPATLAEAEERHTADSAQILALAPPGARSWADLGSGGGFPGLVVAILAGELRPGLAVTLIESDQRKAVFLQEAARLTRTQVEILATRIERLQGRRFDVVSARAVAPLPDLLALAAPILAPGGLCLFPKGARAESELTSARRTWNMVVREVPSRTDPEARIVCITELQRAT